MYGLAFGVPGVVKVEFSLGTYIFLWWRVFCAGEIPSHLLTSQSRSQVNDSRTTNIIANALAG